MNTFIDVFLKHDKYGNKVPMFIRWNNGTLYVIDRLRKVSRAVSKSGMQVLKYDVVIGGHETSIFEDRYLNKWYVEEK
ncbi:MAG: hypothetical protein K5755_05735 [Clostridiales bacterium]|nr:hypothetical protein [Clostridia bacterium]MCR4564118.1 hypothetical protein [Clostridiales bacterium]